MLIFPSTNWLSFLSAEPAKFYIFLYQWFECLTTLRILICRTKPSKARGEERSPATGVWRFHRLPNRCHASMELRYQAAAAVTDQTNKILFGTKTYLKLIRNFQRFSLSLTTKNFFAKIISILRVCDCNICTFDFLYTP